MGRGQTRSDSEGFYKSIKAATFIETFPNYNQIILALKNNSKKNKKGKGEKIFNYSLAFYCAFPTFTGSAIPTGVLQRLAPHTMSSVADPYDFGDIWPGLPSDFCANATSTSSGANATIARGKIANNPMYFVICFMDSN